MLSESQLDLLIEKIKTYTEEHETERFSDYASFEGVQHGMLIGLAESVQTINDAHSIVFNLCKRYGVVDGQITRLLTQFCLLFVTLINNEQKLSSAYWKEYDKEEVSYEKSTSN